MQFKKTSRVVLAASVAMLCAIASAQTYPTKSVNIIIPFPPGGTLDIVGRMLAQKLTEQTGQSFIVENRAGGGGTIGANAVAKASPDGYTLLFSASTFTIAPMLVSGVPYNVEKDFIPVSLIAKAPLAVAIGNHVPANNVKELIAYGKANPGKLSFAIGSSGSAGHLSTELLKKAGGVSAVTIPYKGSSPAYTDLVGGRIDGFIDPILGSQPFAKAGKLKVIAVTSKNRLASMPGIPAVSESVPGYEFYSWYGLWAPAGTPAAVVAKLSSEALKALTGDMAKKLIEQGLIVEPGTAADFAKFQKADMTMSQTIIKEANISAQ
jgi:tripartite-type tricarboxylate transporter receptor subunit TctC